MKARGDPCELVCVHNSVDTAWELAKQTGDVDRAKFANFPTNWTCYLQLDEKGHFGPMENCSEEGKHFRRVKKRNCSLMALHRHDLSRWLLFSSQALDGHDAIPKKIRKKINFYSIFLINFLINFLIKV
jgi:hypothetical protein